MRDYTRFFQPATEQSFFLFGPRGTGKSTLMRKLFKDALWIDFLKPQTERTFTAKPETLYDFLAANKSVRQVVIDEVQKVPAVLTVVHDNIESKDARQFILTGSSARKIKRSGADLLAGRALNYTLHPFMATELGHDFDLAQALEFGLLPLINQAQDKEEVLQAYISLYLKEEVQAEGLVRNIASFARFLEGFSFSHGSVLNTTNVAKECEVARKTVENYISILSDLLLMYELPVFSKHAKRDLIKSNKVYYFDAGVYNALRPKGFLDQPGSIVGPSLEGLVLQNLIAWNDYSKNKSQIYYWHTRSDLEVDFIIYNANELIAIEVKNTKNPCPDDVKSLRAFLQDYPMAKCMLLYMGDTKRLQRNILCLPVKDFLMNLFPDKSCAIEP
ncbi:MAG TPA: AAA family ATPase [Gammaproteobacteria bacterium]|nr:AAA family ATPase [Gammaproteobacteria bacterium]